MFPGSRSCINLVSRVVRLLTHIDDARAYIVPYLHRRFTPRQFSFSSTDAVVLLLTLVRVSVAARSFVLPTLLCSAVGVVVPPWWCCCGASSPLVLRLDHTGTTPSSCRYGLGRLVRISPPPLLFSHHALISPLSKLDAMTSMVYSPVLSKIYAWVLPCFADEEYVLL